MSSYFPFSSDVHIDISYGRKLRNCDESMLLVTRSRKIREFVKNYSAGHTHGPTEHASVSYR